MTEQQQLPPGATPIDVRDFFLCIGELYFQLHTLRAIVQEQQQRTSPNGLVRDAVPQQS